MRTLIERKPILLFILALSSVAPAEEVVHFTNGTTMVVVSHAAEDGMIHLDLGPDARIAFPLELVDRIEPAGDRVRIDRSFAGRPDVNRVASRASGTDSVASPPDNPGSPRTAASIPSHPGNGRMPADNGRVSNDQLPESSGDLGIATVYPLANHPNETARKLGVVGGGGAEHPSGVRRMGDKWVVDTRRNASPRGDPVQLQTPRGPKATSSSGE